MLSFVNTILEFYKNFIHGVAVSPIRKLPPQLIHHPPQVIRRLDAFRIDGIGPLGHQHIRQLLRDIHSGPFQKSLRFFDSK